MFTHKSNALKMHINEDLPLTKKVGVSFNIPELNIQNKFLTEFGDVYLSPNLQQ